MTEKANGTRIALDSLGCKLNQAEIELLARQFTEAGYTVVSPDDRADIYILNTCTVTHIADRKSRHQLRMAHMRNPDALLVATGCYAQRAPRELARIEGVRIVLDNNEKTNLLQVLAEAGYINSRTPALDKSAVNHRSISRTRALVKVQDGCSSFCSYCIVPLVRNREESLPAERVVAEVSQRAAEGYREVILTGVKIGSYNYNGINLKGLLELILAGTEIERLRLSSLQPPEISPGLIGLWRNDRLCRHFHMSLQSGSDAVLRRMNRQYTAGEYEQSVSLIRTLVPGAAITTDIMVGFPGETGTEFEKSYDFCRQIEFARIHVFPYSPREGTGAAVMPEQIGDRIKRQRSRKMLALAGESAQNFSRRFQGETMPVLWEKQTDGTWSGLTDNYVRVYTRSSGDLSNRLLPAKLTEVRENVVWGEIVET